MPRKSYPDKINEVIPSSAPCDRSCYVVSMLVHYELALLGSSGPRSTTWSSSFFGNLGFPALPYWLTLGVLGYPALPYGLTFNFSL